MILFMTTPTGNPIHFSADSREHYKKFQIRFKHSESVDRYSHLEISKHFTYLNNSPAITPILPKKGLKDLKCM